MLLFLLCTFCRVRVSLVWIAEGQDILVKNKPRAIMTGL